MRLTITVLGAFMALGLCLTAPALAKTPTDAEALMQAEQALGSDPAKVLALVEPIIMRSEAMTPKDNTDYSCSDDAATTLMNLIEVSGRKRNGVVYNGGVCSALFMKGFSLIDLKRGAEAEPFLRRATELAPGNAHYLNEYAEWYKSARQWQRSYDLFARAADLAPKQPTDVRNARHARALRGMGFNLIELGRLDDAERLMNQSLKLEPDSEAAKNELAYIAEQRAKAAKH